MSHRPTTVKRVVIIGGGITGLAAAYRLMELDASIEITLLEAAGRLGGVLETVREDGFCLERSADNFITAVPWALDFCRRLGYADQLIGTDETRRRAFVVHKGRLEPIPEGFLIMAPSRIGPMLRTPILSLRGKLRLLAELFVRAKKDDRDESLASFATRRLGRETYQRLVQPLVGGIYTADPDKLSLAASLPRFAQMEREYGSLIRAALRQPAERSAEPVNSGARYSMFVAPREGMSHWIDAIAARLPRTSIQLSAPVNHLYRLSNGGWKIAVDGKAPQSVEADAVIVATPAYQAERLFHEMDGPLAAKIGRIPHAPCAIVSLGYRREQVGHALDGFGFVTPLVEGREILSASFSSVKYPGRAPADCELFRVFIGGACQPELVDLPDTRLRMIAQKELADLLLIKGEPIFDHISRWPSTMPQYHVGHTQLIGEIQDHVARLDGIELAGNAYHGVGIPQCIHSGEGAAERLIAQFGDPGKRNVDR